MYLGGTFEIHGTTYFVSLEEIKSRRTWKVISPVHKEDLSAELFGREYKHRILEYNDVFNFGIMDQGYLLESITQTRGTNKTSVYGTLNLIQEITELIQKAQTYSFAEQDVQLDEVKSSNGVVRKTKIARDFNMYVNFTKKNGLFSSIAVDHSGLKLDLREGNRIRIRSKITYVPIEQEKQATKRTVSSVAALDYEALREVLDLSWYEKDGVILKNYRSIKNIKEFEEHLIVPVMNALAAAKARGEKLRLGLDTETTGLVFYDLSKNNENLDRIVAIPISWEDDQGVVVFVDMEYFSNVPLDYVLSRLRELIEYSSGHRTLEKRRVYADEGGILPDGSYSKDCTFHWDVEGEWEFNREDIHLTGHNAMFDGRVFYHYGISTYWNEDTLQMCFNLNPRVVKGSVALKNLTHRLFGAETPELSDILGKGNEGNYRYITDERVAIVYGCADTDFTLKLQKVARKAMTDRMYRQYQKQDIPIMNRLFISEYKGLPIKMDTFLEDAEFVRKDLATLTDYMQHYVGTVVEYRNKVDILTKSRAAGFITDEQFLQYRSRIRVASRKVLESELESGIISATEFNEATEFLVDSDTAFYEFELAGDDLRRVIFDILNYPIIFRTKPTKKHPEGQPSIDKKTIERLMKIKRDTPSDLLREDLLSSNGKDKLLEKDIVNSLKYPLAYVLSVYKKLDKEWTSYYEPITKTNMEGRLFKSYSMARIETRRIMNPAQTMKASMKRNVVSLGPDWYLVDFDQAQAEPRIMVSLSGDKEEIKKYDDPENDYHTENAARIVGVLPHALAKYIRKIYKSITLGIPYGLGDRKMCEQIHSAVDDKLLFRTRSDITLWKKINHAIWKKLTEFQRTPLKPADDLSPELRDFIWKTTRTEDDPDPKVYGKIENLHGFYRLFDITDLKSGDKGAEGKIMRPSGNYPIQSLAAEIFRQILMRFYNLCVEHGIEDKVVWHMLIHDELLMSVHKSVHPFLLYKLLHKACTVRAFPGSTKFFIGINIGDTWAECKDDMSEAPVRFVERIIERWDAGEFRDDDYQSDIKGYIHKHMHEFFVTRIGEEVLKIHPSFKDGVIDLKYMMDNFKRYTVRSYIPLHFKPNRPVNKKDEDALFESCFETWCIEFFGEGKEIKGLDGVVRAVYKNKFEQTSSVAEAEEDELSLDDDETLFQEEYWTFDDSEMEDIAYSRYVYEDDDYEEDLLEQHRNLAEQERAGGTAVAVKQAVKYKHVDVINKQLVISVPRGFHVNKLKAFLSSHRTDSGLSVVIKHPLGREHWARVDKNIDLAAIDEFVKGL